MSDVAKNFNLIQIGSKWHYRRRVPKGLKAAFKSKAVIKYAFKTSDLNEARQRRDIGEVKWNEKFNRLRARSTENAQLPIQALGNEEAKELIRDYVVRELKPFSASVENNPPSDSVEREDMVMEEEFILQNLKLETRLNTEALQVQRDGMLSGTCKPIHILTEIASFP
jgi:hypothetical protein